MNVTLRLAMYKHKPPAVLDKNVLQRICELGSPEMEDERIHFLKENFQIAVTYELVVETMKGYSLSSDKTKALHRKMLKRILDFYPHWIEPAPSLVFKQLILKIDLDTCLGLDPAKARVFYRLISQPESYEEEFAKVAKIFQDEKSQRLQTRIALQKVFQESKLFQEYLKLDLLNPPDFRSFLENNRRAFEFIMQCPDLKHSMLKASLGEPLKRWHSEHAGQIDQALAVLDCKQLDGLPFTRNYLLAEWLYDVGPVTRIGKTVNENNQRVLSVKEEKQINNEQDQQYVAAAFACEHLFTCDKEMHRIANLFSQAHLWDGSSVLIKQSQIENLEEFIACFTPSLTGSSVR